MISPNYEITGTVNIDRHSCFSEFETYPNFQDELKIYKSQISDEVTLNKAVSYYKFGDGDYYFLKKEKIGSAKPGNRALSKSYRRIDHKLFFDGFKKCDFYTCEIYPENRLKFKSLYPEKEIDFPAEFSYGLVANKWFFQQFSGKIGLIGADKKIRVIQKLMDTPEYQSYLGLTKFEDYIGIPQLYACDDIVKTKQIIAEQLVNSTSQIFLLGIGHAKSAILHNLKNYKQAVYVDIGSGIDAIAGIIDIRKPYFGSWVNFQFLDRKLYGDVDFLGYESLGAHRYL